MLWTGTHKNTLSNLLMLYVIQVSGLCLPQASDLLFFCQNCLMFKYCEVLLLQF